MWTISKRRSGAAPEFVGAMPATFAGEYLLERAVAACDTGAVWRAETLPGRTPVALKLFSSRWLANPARLDEAQLLVDAFSDVASDGIVPPSRVLLHGRYAAFVTPWVEGAHLRDSMHGRSGGAYDVDEVREWLGSLLDALEAIHARGHVHGGLHAEVVFPRQRDVRVVGWGMNAWIRRVEGVRWRDSRDTARLGYVSPQQLSGAPPSRTDDIYAFGALLYEALSGVAPVRRWGGRAPVEVEAQRRRRGVRHGAIPVVWQRTISQCLQSSPTARPESVHGLRLRLELARPARRPRSVPEQRPSAPIPAPVAAAPIPAAPVVTPREKIPEPPQEETSWDAPVSAPETVADPQRTHVGDPAAVEPAALDEAPAGAAAAAARSEEPARRSPVAVAETSAVRPIAHKPPEPAWRRPVAVEPVVRPAAADPYPIDGHVRGVHALRATLAVFVALTVAVGAWLVWQVTERGAREARAMRHSLAERAEPGVAREGKAPIESARGESPSRVPAAVASPDPQGAAASKDRADALAGQQAGPEPAESPARTVRAPTPQADAPRRPATEAPRSAGTLGVSRPPGAPLRLTNEVAALPAAGPPLNQGVLELGLVDVPPRPVVTPGPKLQQSVAVGTRGYIELILVIDRMGRVASAAVYSTSDETLVEPSLQAARQWRFTPAHRQGQPVAVRVAVPLVFEARRT